MYMFETWLSAFDRHCSEREREISHNAAWLGLYGLSAPGYPVMLLLPQLPRWGTGQKPAPLKCVMQTCFNVQFSHGTRRRQTRQFGLRKEPDNCHDPQFSSLRCSADEPAQPTGAVLVLPMTEVIFPPAQSKLGPTAVLLPPGWRPLLPASTWPRLSLCKSWFTVCDVTVKGLQLGWDASCSDRWLPVTLHNG